MNKAFFHGKSCSHQSLKIHIHILRKCHHIFSVICVGTSVANTVEHVVSSVSCYFISASVAEGVNGSEPWDALCINTNANRKNNMLSAIKSSRWIDQLDIKCTAQTKFYTSLAFSTTASTDTKAINMHFYASWGKSLWLCSQTSNNVLINYGEIKGNVVSRTRPPPC